MNLIKLDSVFSKFIRLSGVGENGMVRCFTCPAEMGWMEITNGHFIGRGNMATRFSVVNCKPQCDRCNADCHYGGEKQAVFEERLREMYGDKVIDDLILSARGIKKWAQWEIDMMEDEYLAKIVEIQAIKGV